MEEIITLNQKPPRNLLKNKSIYKPGSINVGNVYFGKGLYVSDDVEIAKWYAKFSKNASLVKMHIKDNTSIIDFTKPESEVKLQDALGLKPDEIKKYLQDLCHHPLLLKHYREESDPYITIKSPEVVTQCDLSDDLENWHKPSLNRLDEKKHEIKGHPTQFKEIKVPDGTKMTRVEEATAKGNALCDGFPVLSFRNKNQVEYVVQSPADENVYLAVLPAPHNSKLFILEPCPDFLASRRMDKLNQLSLDGWPESKGIIKSLWKKFQKN